MIKKEERDKLLEELPTTSYGKALLDYLEEKIKDLSDIEKANKDDFQARKEAVRFVKQLFNFLKREKRGVEQSKNQFI